MSYLFCLNLKLNRKCRGITKHMYVCSVNSGDNHQHQMVKKNKTRGTTELNKMFDFIFISTVPTERVSERARICLSANVRAAIFRFHRNFSHRQSLLAKFRGVKYVHFRFRYGVLAVECFFFRSVGDLFVLASFHDGMCRSFSRQSLEHRNHFVVLTTSYSSKHSILLLFFSLLGIQIGII